MRTLALVLAALCAPAACEWPLGSSPERPSGAVEFTPPPRYERLFNEVRACSGLQADFSQITWYVVPGETFHYPPDGKQRTAAWYYPADIYLAESRVGPGNDGTIMHESLHVLLGARGHPIPPFDHCAPRYPTPPEP